MMESAMAVETATTVGGQRTFNGGLVVSWTPSTTSNSVTVSMSLGGSLVWAETFEGNVTKEVSASGNSYSIKGSLEARFSGSGADGQVWAPTPLIWKLGGTEYKYEGIIGVW